MLRVTNGTAILKGVKLFLPTNTISPAVTIFLFSRDFATNSLNGRFAVTNWSDLMGPAVLITNVHYYPVATNRVAGVSCEIPVKGNAGDRAIRVGIMANDTAAVTLDSTGDKPTITFTVKYQ